MKKFLIDFKAFAAQGNVLNLAVGVMIGGAFGKIVASLVNDIFMPILGLVTGGIDFSGLFIALDGGHYASIQEAVDRGAATLNYGAFLTNIFDFFLIALCVFIVVRLVSKALPKKAEPPKTPTKACPCCLSEINAAATRCPCCTSALASETQQADA